ncbi:MAG: hypothetical protein ACFHX7_22170 [Pseudomonadota bacterium]
MQRRHDTSQAFRQTHRIVNLEFCTLTGELLLEVVEPWQKKPWLVWLLPDQHSFRAVTLGKHGHLIDCPATFPLSTAEILATEPGRAFANFHMLPAENLGLFESSSLFLLLASPEPLVSQLIKDSPILAWLAADAVVSQNSGMASLPAMVQRPRHEILHQCRLIQSETAARLLHRIQYTAITPTLLKLVRLALRSPQAIARLAQLDTIQLGHLWMAARAPALANTLCFRHWDDSMAPDFDQMVTMLSDAQATYLKLEALARSLKFEQRLLLRCRTPVQMERLATRWAKRIRLGQVLPTPPRPGNQHITPIETMMDLKLHGEAQENCVFTQYADEALAGEIYFYRVVVKREIGTLAIRDQGTDSQFQLAGKNNAWASDAMRKLVVSWMNDTRIYMYKNRTDTGEAAGNTPNKPL